MPGALAVRLALSTSQSGPRERNENRSNHAARSRTHALGTLEATNDLWFYPSSLGTTFRRGPLAKYRFGEGQFSHREALDGDTLNRCSELRRRNSMVPLHLESCYTFETRKSRLPPNALTAEASFAYPRLSGATDELTMSPMTATGSSTGGENNAKRWGRTTSPVVHRKGIGRRPFSGAIISLSETLPGSCQCPETLALASVAPVYAITLVRREQTEPAEVTRHDQVRTLLERPKNPAGLWFRSSRLGTTSGRGPLVKHRFCEGQFSHREAPNEDPLNRCSELHPRNSMVTLNLKSCYTVETQESRLPPNALTAEASFAYPCVSGATDELTMSPMTAMGSSTSGENNAKRWGCTTSPVLPHQCIGQPRFSRAIPSPYNVLPGSCQCPETLASVGVAPAHASRALRCPTFRVQEKLASECRGSNGKLKDSLATTVHTEGSCYSLTPERAPL
ncbi:hypothetical protein HPB48_018016 [Haemaphysalis longicornis]|uniref:Uncharacterized protein n=1 Tax=Haemaphysalis longicornis TaxID=44386 RepID=A0A9J6FK72_HAELO|nr:hypothetical protein HPB48_018016 [Haemaphysalis longicornis]